MKLFGYEFIIRKTIKRKKGYSKKHWTTAETNTALKWRNEGIATHQIAKDLNRTVASVNARLWKVRR